MPPKRNAKRKVGRPKKMRKFAPRARVGGIYRFKRWAGDNPILIQGNDTTGINPGLAGSQTFNINQVSGAAEFTQLFDQYKIVGIKYRWVMSRSPDWYTTTANRGLYPFMIWAHDYDGNSGIPDASMLRQYPNCKEFQFTEAKSHTRWFYFRPATQNTMFQTSIVSAYGPRWNQWIDCSYGSVPHYSIQYICQPLPQGANISLEAVYYLHFKGVR